MRCARCQQEHPPDGPCLATAGTPEAVTYDGATVLRGGAAALPRPAQEADLVGGTLGSYRVVRELGRGGMGVVYLGEHTSIGSRVAIKVLHRHLASSADQVERFWAEAKSVNLVAHSNIINIFDLVQLADSTTYLVMEYLEGQSLAEAGSGPMTAERAIPILVQVCDALEAAHRRSVVHRDVKPENIFLVKRGRRDDFVKVLDFGIAKLRSSDGPTEQTGAGFLVGTPDYMSPEQANGGTVDGRADVYALGCVAYRLATGRLPFIAPSIPAVLVAHATHTPEPPERLNPAVTARWSAAILRALQKDPALRHQTAAELATELEAVLRAPTPGAASASAPAPAPSPRSTEAEAIGPRAGAFAPVARTPVPAPADPPSPEAADLGAAEVRDDAGKLLGTFPASAVGREGFFLQTDGGLPPLMSRLQLKVPKAGNLTCSARVVQHLDAGQAKQWSMKPGFGVQLEGLSESQKRRLREAAHPGAEPRVSAGSSTVRPDDAEAAATLARYRAKAGQDWYALLGVRREADFETVRRQLREARRGLDGLAERPLSAAQREQLADAQQHLLAARDTLATPQRRAPYDASLGNFEGVWHCISAGLSVTELESARARFLAEHAGAETHANLNLVRAQAFEKGGRLRDALESYAQSLVFDPLNLRVHRLYWALRQRLSATSPSHGTPQARPK